VRPAAGASYGVVPFARAGDAVTVPLPPGDVRVLLRAGDRWASVRTPEGGGEWRVPFADFQPGAQVRIPLRGASGGQVRLFRIEDGREVLAQGLTRSVRGVPEVLADVPPGSYRLEWLRADGPSRHPAVHTMPPGGRMRIPLD
jgi:hypothetical protein